MLHEIVSPAFMNQRQLATGTRVLPARDVQSRPSSQTDTPEDLIFDKADERASIEALRAERQKLKDEIAALEESSKTGTAEQRVEVETEIERRRARVDVISSALDRETSRSED